MAAKLEVVADNTGMPLYRTMCNAISECHRVDEVLAIRDDKLALKLYNEQAGNKENERMVIEIRLRAERRIGELTAKLPKAKTRSRYDIGLTVRRAANPASKREVLKKNNISDRQSRAWEKIATIPEPEFETEVIKPGASTRRLLNYARNKEQSNPKAKTAEPKWSTDPKMDMQLELMSSLKLISKSLKRASVGLKFKDHNLAEMMEADVKLPELVMVELAKIRECMTELMVICPCPLKRGGKAQSSTSLTVL
jgi:hypothetical protein